MLFDKLSDIFLFQDRGNVKLQYIGENMVLISEFFKRFLIEKVNMK